MKKGQLHTKLPFSFIHQQANQHDRLDIRVQRVMIMYKTTEQQGNMRLNCEATFPNVLKSHKPRRKRDMKEIEDLFGKPIDSGGKHGKTNRFEVRPHPFA
jgi:hypothetical protein